MDMEKIDLLLLDYLSEMPSGFGFFLSLDADSVFNRPHHGLTQKQLRIQVSNLIASGYITADINDPAGDARSGRLTDSLAPDDTLSLTAAGGAIWERYYKPNWKDYIADEFKLLENGKVEIKVGSISKATLARYLSPIADENLQIMRIENWRATYWKSFAHGYVATFSIGEEIYDAEIAPRKPVWRNWDNGGRSQ